MATEPIVCSVCGVSNDKGGRCVSCGAKLDTLGHLTPEEIAAREGQQTSFHWKWVGVAVLIFGVLQGIAIGALPMVIDAYQPQGLAAMMISGALWFVGAIIVGAISPGRTFIEPVVAALIVVGPTVFWIDKISDVYAVSFVSMVVGGMLGVMVTILGSFVGERIQMGKS